MQAAKTAVENIKETAANLGASAKSGYDKTKATIQEQTEKMGAHDQVEKDLATMRKEERINQAEMEKQLAHMQNAAAKHSALSGHMDQGLYTATGPGTQSPVIDPSGPGAVTANTTGTPGPENFVHSNTGLGTGTATYSTTGPGYVNVLPTDTDSGAATYNSSVPWQGNILSSSSGPGAGTGSQTAAFPAADYGQTEANQGAMMPGHGTGPGLGQGIGLGHFHGHGQAVVTDDVVGTLPTDTNTRVVEGPATIGTGSAPASGPN